MPVVSIVNNFAKNIISLSYLRAALHKLCQKCKMVILKFVPSQFIISRIEEASI